MTTSDLFALLLAAYAVAGLVAWWVGWREDHYSDPDNTHQATRPATA